MKSAGEAVEAAQRIARGEAGTLSVGFTGSAIYELFPASSGPTTSASRR
jgi:hypothetical protein